MTYENPDWRYLPGVERLVAIAHYTVGWHLPEYADHLHWLVSRGIDPPDSGVEFWRTNCATSLLGWIGHACLTPQAASEVHPLLGKRSENGTALARVVQILRDKGAIPLRDGHDQPTHEPLPDEPAFLWYGTAGLNNDHVALLCTPTMPDGCGDITEGGGANNSINRSVREVGRSWGRPLRLWLPVRALGLPPAEQRPEEREAVELQKAEMEMKAVALQIEASQSSIDVPSSDDKS